MDLKEKIIKEIEDVNFDSMEMAGFKKNPRWALIAGALIGYSLALDEFADSMEKQINKGK